VCHEVKSVKSLGKEIESEKDRKRDVHANWANIKIEISESSSDPKCLLRSKIRRHKSSAAHTDATRIMETARKNKIQEAVLKQSKHAFKCTENLFRTVYYGVKRDRPFTDYEHLVELNQLNGADMGKTLHSRYSAVEITNCIHSQMKELVVENIIKNNSKIVVLVDESTSLSKKSCIVIYLKTVVNEGAPIFVLLEIAELADGKAETIYNCILQTLKSSGFSMDWLQQNFIGFISDGASVLLGKKNGVAARLKATFPDLFTLHCMNHRLELAVGDTVEEISGVANFTGFVGAVYTVYSMSPKNVAELSEICSELGIQMRIIGRVFDVRWVASSLRTVKAIWMSYEALYKHFSSAAIDVDRLPKMKAKYRGLKATLQSTNFVLNLGILYDVLEELSSLSLKLQNRGTDILLADKDIRRSICYFESMKSHKDVYFDQAHVAVNQICFKNVPLILDSEKSTRHKQINDKQLIQSLIVNLTSRLLEGPEEIKEILECSKVLFPENWTRDEKQEVNIRYGQQEIVKLCKKFKCDEKLATQGLREYIFSPDSFPKSLKPLKDCLNSLACGTAECERGFSAMNLIVTELRTLLSMKNLNALMFIKINGPPVSKFNPEKYINKWLLHHRNADDNKTRKVGEKSIDADKKELFSLLS